MGLSKLAITLIASSIGVVAIGGTVTAVVVSRQNEVQNIDTNNKEEFKPASIIPNEIPSNDQPSKTQVTIEDLQKQIDASSIVINNNNKEEAVKEHYAFNANNKNLKVANGLVPKEFETHVSLIKDKNPINKLNNGELNIEVVIKQINGTNKELKKQLIIKNFKKADSSLKELLDAKSNSDETDDKYSLSITPRTDASIKYISLEDLNKHELDKTPKDNGLTKWLKNSTLKAKQETLSDVMLDGLVKVKEIKKDQGKTYFVLTSANEDEYIKLSKTQEGKVIGQIAIGQIKTTNLLASDLTVVAKNNNVEKASELTKKLKEIKTQGMYKFNENNSSLSFSVPKVDDAKSNSAVDVFLNPYVVDVKKEGIDSISLDLKINFGKGDYLTTFNTSTPQTFNLLKDAGFEFYFYSKRLNETNDEISSQKLLEEGKKLEEYFNTNNFTNPIMKPIMEVDTRSGANNEFSIKGPIKELTSSNLTISITKETTPKNYIVFSSYTYGGLEEKILFTPSLSLIRLDTTIKN